MGIAQTKVIWEDIFGNVYDPIYFRFSTKDPKESLLVSWSSDGKKFESMDSAPQEVKDAEKSSGLDGVAKYFREGIEQHKKRNPHFDGSKIDSEKFIKYLNDYCDKNGVQAYWTDKNADTPTKQEKVAADKRDITVVKATGIFSHSFGRYSFVKYGLEHGSPIAVSFDENGKKTGQIPPEHLVGKGYVSDTLSSPEKFAEVPNEEVANLIEYVYLHKHSLKVSDVLWKGGDVDFKSLEREFESTLSARENKKDLIEQLIETRLKDAEREDWKKKGLLSKSASIVGKVIGKVLKKLI